MADLARVVYPAWWLCSNSLQRGKGLQGAELMSNFGINVAPGIAIKSMEEVEGAVNQMKDKDGQVLSSDRDLTRSCFP